MCRILQRPEQTANQYLQVASFTATQNQMLKALEHSTATQWSVSRASADDTLKQGRELMGKGERAGIAFIMKGSLFIDGGSDKTVKSEDLANGVLDLPEETLEGTIAKLVGA